MKVKDKKKLLIGTLCALIMIMAVGYALLAQQLSITGSTSITSNWQVEITSITEKEKSIGATTNSTNYTETTASFNTSLTSPGDYAIYEVTVTNKGTLDAVLAVKPTVATGNNEAIEYELEGIKKGDKILKNNGMDTFTIKVQYNSSITSQPNAIISNVSVILNYQQDLGQVTPYDAYAIGDVISFNNANWRVIKASTADEDYVIVMKETVLTTEEIGDNYTWKSTSAQSVMPYYWGYNCHSYGTYGTVDTYGDIVDGTVNGSCVTSFQYSKIKLAVEDYMSNYLDETKLKEVEDYKIRLITREELVETFVFQYKTVRCGRTCTKQKLAASDATPAWIYDNFGTSSYWTMTPQNNYVNTVSNDGFLNSFSSYATAGVRPVINLLKSAIE